MGNITLKNVPLTIALDEINFENPNINDKEAVLEAIELLEDYLYILNRQSKVDDYVEEKQIKDLISKYK